MDEKAKKPVMNRLIFVIVNNALTRRLLPGCASAAFTDERQPRDVDLSGRSASFHCLIRDDLRWFLSL
jgi:hypothetical protein